MKENQFIYNPVWLSETLQRLQIQIQKAGRSQQMIRQLKWNCSPEQKFYLSDIERQLENLVESFQKTKKCLEHFDEKAEAANLRAQRQYEESLQMAHTIFD